MDGWMDELNGRRLVMMERGARGVSVGDLKQKIHPYGKLSCF